MRKTIFALTLLAAFGIFPPTSAKAGNDDNKVTYALPKTVVEVEVKGEKEMFFAGPYAKYAAKYLGIEVRQEDSVETRVTEVSLVPKVGADLSARYTVPTGKGTDAFLEFTAQGLVAFEEKPAPESVRWRFNPPVEKDFGLIGLTEPSTLEKRTAYREVRTDSTFTRIPVQQEVEVGKTVEQKAREAAGLILRARKEKFNISVGDTDATFSGEALGSALDQLSKVEQEYLTMFTGYSVTTEFSASYEVVPQASRKSRTYPVFGVSKAEGLTGADGDTVYSLVFSPEPVAEPEQDDAQTAKKKKKKVVPVIHYRIPAACRITLTDGRNELISMTAPVYQFGRDMTHPITK